MERCGANRRTEPGTCQKPAGWGTPYNKGPCKLHGGNTKPHLIRNARELAAEAVQSYGMPRKVDPVQALVEELHRTAGHVAWLSDVVAQLTKGKGKLVEKTMFGEQPSVWLKLHERERKHLAEVAQACIRAGIEERRVRIAEQQGLLLAAVIKGILMDLGVHRRPEVPEVVRRHLTQAALTNGSE